MHRLDITADPEESRDVSIKTRTLKSKTAKMHISAHFSVIAPELKCKWSNPSPENETEGKGNKIKKAHIYLHGM